MKKNSCLTGIVLLALTGCSSIPPAKEYTLTETKIFCDDSEKISEQYYKLRPLPPNTFGDAINGYNWIDGIHVMWSGDYDKNREPLPDFETLGHEVWHRIKGAYHK